MTTRDQELADEVRAALTTRPTDRAAPPPARSEAELLRVFERALRTRNASKSTLRSLLSAARVFLRRIGKPVARVRPDDLRRYLARRADELSPLSQVAELSRLRSFFQALLAAGLVSSDPTTGLAVDHADSPPQLLLGEETVAKLLAAALEGPRYPTPFFQALRLRDRACLELLYGTGLRQLQVREVRVVDLDLPEATLLVRPVKRGKPHPVPLPKPSVHWLSRYLTEARPLLVREDGRDQGHFLVSYTGLPLDPSSGVQRIVATVAARADIRAHPHAFRRALASQLVERGADVKAVSELLGHRDLEQLATYAEVALHQLRRAVEVLDRSSRSPS